MHTYTHTHTHTQREREREIHTLILSPVFGCACGGGTLEVSYLNLERAWNDKLKAARRDVL